jgi:hydrogenase maturation protein HypF
MERRAIAIQGIVQGVGFRPFVHGLASRLGLRGFVKNGVGGVLIEVEGDAAALDCFVAEIAARPPPLARIDRLAWEAQAPRGDDGFRIEVSAADDRGPVFVSPDVATCAACLAELLDPADRRFRYPFLNCTDCGPRLTIITGAPYDRPRTTMAGFALCPACKAEYEDPENRRFHAQPTCCAACGPRLRLLDARGSPVECADPLTAFAAALRAGRIGALKGLGGYHLACDARSPAAVAELRRRKHRDEKPFAVMVADAMAAEMLCDIRPEERELLESPRRPIVLLRRRPGAVADEVAPRNPNLGVLLPYTPLHHLLLHEMAGVPLVMTSGNRSDEPIAYDDQDACRRLAGIADVFLTHDRPIRVRCEDSVTRCVDGAELPIRRSRGDAPQPIPLPLECPVPTLAVGGQLKGTFALGRGAHAFLSHHLGDLDHFDAYKQFVHDIGLYEQLFGIEPRLVAHDLHPDYGSTRYALTQSPPASPCSTTTPTSPAAWPSTGSTSRSSASAGTAPATAPTAPSGAASSSSATTAASAGRRTCATSACPAASAPSRSRGAWPWRTWRTRTLTRIRSISASPRRPCAWCGRCWSGASTCR